jgi:hypothetical protein
MKRIKALGEERLVDSGCGWRKERAGWLKSTIKK